MVVALLSCALPSGGPTWTPVDIPAIQARIDTPTATQAQVAAWLLSESATIGLLASTGATFTQTMSTVSAGQQTEVSRDTGRLSGTEVFIRAACSGPGSAPDPDFAYGRIEIESPLLSLDELQEVALGGDLLLTADACQDGETRFDGRLAAWYGAEDALLVLDGGLDITAADADTVALHVEGVLGVLWQLVVPLTGTDATLSLDLNPDAPGTAAIRYDGGVLDCVVDAAVVCMER